MQQPGSDPAIPEEATLVFEEQWNTMRPGTKQKMAFLKLNDGTLRVFPHKTWDPPIGEPRRCVLYVVRNAAVAAPVGGVPETERIELDGPQADLSRDGTLPTDEASQEAIAVKVKELADQLGEIVDALDELAERLAPGL